MSTAVKLLGPDLPGPLALSLESSASVLHVKEAAVAAWPSGGAPPARAARLADAPSGGSSRDGPRSSGGSTPAVAQLRIIHGGRFLTDDKYLKGARAAPSDGQIAGACVPW